MFWTIIIILVLFGVLLYMYKYKSYQPADKLNGAGEGVLVGGGESSKKILGECPENCKSNPMTYGLYNIIKSKKNISEGFNIYFTIMDDIIVQRDIDPELHDWETVSNDLVRLVNDCNNMLNIAITNSKLSMTDENMIKETHGAIVSNISIHISKKYNKQSPI